jgi:dipeptidyl aminopeptidase/acylaminoacyl peptidase
MPTTNPSRRYLFAGICVAAVGGTLGYATLRPAPSRSLAAAVEITAAPAEALATAAGSPHLLFRSTAFDKGTGGQMGLLPLEVPDAAPLFTTLSCDRLYFAGGTGMCLAADRGMATSYYGDVFDRTFQARRRVPLSGAPSRTRVAPDGKIAASTNFVSGDSYASGGFSTRTLLIDTTTGEVLGNLESYAVTRDNKPFTAADFNFWGVTFTRQPGRFYATLASGGQMYLIEGDIAGKTARVIRGGVECPSLSPDNRRIAYKKREPGWRLVWRIHVLDLQSGVETPLAETRSVDDQVEWLDDQTILYAVPNGAMAQPVMDVWAAAADGSGTPRVLLTNADSPVVVRPITAQR